jgi:hypothetical protein
MALTSATLNRILKYGRYEAEQHPQVEEWYNTAILDEDPASWGVLYAEAMAAKAAHFCLKFIQNGDGNGRGLITSEATGNSSGTRQYKYDFEAKEFWQSTIPGSLYWGWKSSRLGMRATPVFI